MTAEGGQPREESPGSAPRLLSPPLAELSGWLLCGAYQALAISAPSLGLALRAQAYAFGHMAAAGLVVLATGSSWRRLAKESAAWRVALFTLVVGPLLRVVLETDFEAPLARHSPFNQAASHWALGVFLSALLALCREAVWRWFCRGWRRLLPLAVTGGIGVGHAWMSPLAYAGVHLVVAAAVALVSGAALYGLPIPRLLYPAWRVRQALLLALGVTSAASVFVPPANAVLLALELQPGAVWAHILGPVWARQQHHRSPPGAEGEWFRPRATAPGAPPHAALLARENLIVVLLGIDSMRAAVLEDKRLRKKLPELFRLRDRGVWFRQARSPGASTATTIGPLFAGRPYSALEWALHDRRRPDVFPHRDEVVRFPDLLAGASIPTFTVDTTGWLNGHFALVRGFTEEVDGRRRKTEGPSAYPSAEGASAHLNERLRRQKGGPLFAYVHFMDAHSPYTSAGKAKTPYDGYLKELRLVDEELGRTRRLLEERGLDARTVYIVHADHGEAFGENGLTWHASSLYDAMIRVPLVIAGPGIEPHSVDEPVSLLDLYPTILDLYGLGSPGHVLGQSLVPFLAGERASLTRPIVSEARLKRALITDDLRKVIHDTRTGVAEIYDLREDPGEEHNLFVEDDQSSQDLLDTVSAYFDAHEFKRPGYRTPYRKW